MPLILVLPDSNSIKPVVKKIDPVGTDCVHDIAGIVESKCILVSII